LVVKVSNYF